MDHLTALQPGTDVGGDYRIARVLGAGGFGITYLADEIALQRRVAIKEYFPNDFAARAASQHAAPRSIECRSDYEWGLERFIDEAKALAQFDHPNIVRVFRYFRANNTAYMVLQFEEGQSLKTWLRNLGRRPKQSELDQILGPLLDALQVIHDGAFLHRDIAPDNIILRADNDPVLIDFGSARQELSACTRTVSALVKPGYSPYEQYAETSSQQGPWTDIYALASTLFHAVTGKRPPDAPSRMIKDAFVTAVDTAGSGYRSSFLKAIDQGLALDIGKRPQSVTAWRRDLFRLEEKRSRWLSRGPRPDERAAVGAKAESAATVLLTKQPGITAHRPEAVANAPAATEHITPAAAPLNVFALRRAANAEADDKAAKRRLADALRDAEPAPAAAKTKLKPKPAAASRPKASKRSLRQLLGLAPAEAEAGAKSQKGRVQKGQAAKPNAPAAKHPVKHKAKPKPKPQQIGQPELQPGGQPANREVNRAPTPGILRRVDAKPPGHGLAAAALVVRRKPPQPIAPRLRRTLGPWISRAAAVAVCAGAVVFAWTSVRTLDIPDLPKLADLVPSPPIETGTIRSPLLREIKISDGPLAAAAYTDDDRWLVAVEQAGRITIRWTQGGGIVRSFPLSGGTVTAMALHGRRAVTGHSDGATQLWNLDTGERIALFKRNEARIWSVAFAGAPDRVLTASHDWKVALWAERNTEAPLQTLDAHQNAAQTVSYSAEAGLFASGGADNTLRLWNVDTLDTVRTFTKMSDFVTATAFSNDGSRIAVGTLDGDIRLWRSTRGRSVGRLRGHRARVTRIAWAPDGKTLASASVDGTVRIWSMRRQRTLRTLTSHGGELTAVQFSADGARLMTAGDDGIVRIWATSRLVTTSALQAKQ